MLLPVGSLPDDPLAAAADFHAGSLPKVLAALDRGADQITLVFEPAEHGHREWREAVVATLAREKAPARINAVASSDEAAIAAAETYLAAAPGLTGHYLVLDGLDAGTVIIP